MFKFISNEKEISSGDFYKDDSDEENSDDKNSDEEN